MNDMTRDEIAKEIIRRFESETGLQEIRYTLKDKGDDHFLIIDIANPHNRHFAILESITKEIQSDAITATINKSSPDNFLDSPESRSFLKAVSDVLTINRHSFGEDFFLRYNMSGFRAEDQIISGGNHIVFGRRGSGKSSLLLYALYTRTKRHEPCIWLDLQAYEDRDDAEVYFEILCEIFEQAKPFIRDEISVNKVQERISSIASKGDKIAESDVRKVVSLFKRALSHLKDDTKSIFIFLDDLHLINRNLQPILLSLVYGFCRGNKVQIKISSIETLSNVWDTERRLGLEIPHDIQVIKLDYNLTVVDKARSHIENILDSHARFSGLPSIKCLYKESDTIARLVWVSAGVPRDALSVFTQAMTKALHKSQKVVTITNINLAASDRIPQKLNDASKDSSADREGIAKVIESLKDFCIKEHRLNAFLVEVVSGPDSAYSKIMKLVDLRLVHVIHEGLTKTDAGKKYVAFILDYGFYTGIRAARSVGLFNKDAVSSSYKSLRKLPVFKE